jgi:hypothetical protein
VKERKVTELSGPRLGGVSVVEERKRVASRKRVGRCTGERRTSITSCDSDCHVCTDKTQMHVSGIRALWLIEAVSTRDVGVKAGEEASKPTSKARETKYYIAMQPADPSPRICRGNDGSSV